MELYGPLLVAMSMAETLIVVMILVFLTVPSALLLLDRARAPPGERDEDEADGPPEGVTQRKGPRFRVDGKPFPELVSVEATDEVPHDFDEDDDLPPHAAVTPDYALTEGDVDTGGLLHLGAASRHRGTIRVLGHLGLGHGAKVVGDLHVTGDLRLGPEARVEGTVTVQGDAHLARRAEVEGELQAARILLGPGANVDGPARCARVLHGPGATAFDEVPGVYERTEPSPEVPPQEVPSGGEERVTVEPQHPAATGEDDQEGPS